MVDLSSTLGAGEPARRGARPDDALDLAAAPTADTVASDALLGTIPAAPASAGARGLDAGARVGRYFVIRRLGAGAMGVVYAAYDPKLDRKVALKLLAGLADEGTEGDRQRLQREAQALARLAHPNVVGVFDVDGHDGQVYVAMEFVAGRTLGTWMREQPRPWRAVLDIFLEAGRGLAAAHDAGLVHRDFKPENAMVGDDGRVRVMDFGLARPQGALPKLEEMRSLDSEKLGPQTLGSSLTLTGTAIGTPAYMALEQFEGRADARSDQFSFCVALYEGLYGERPFTSESLTKLLVALAAGDVKPAPRGKAVPTWLRSVVLRGLSPDPEKRWPSMAALLAALADDPARRRRRWAAGILTAGLLAGATGGAIWSLQSQAQTCRGFEARLARVWDEPSKARVRAAIEGTGLSYAAGTWTRVEQRLGDYTGGWVAARRETCEAHQRGEQSGELLDLRMRCLDERLQHVEATVQILSEANAAVVGKAVEAVAGLPTLDRCADEQALRAELPPPEDPELALRVAALDEQLVEAKALERTGKYERGLELAKAVVEEAQTLDYEPLHARAWLVAGWFEDKMGAYDEAEALLERAYASAVGLGMKAEAAEAATQLVHVVGHRQVRHEAGRGWAKSAEPLARAAATPEAQARHFNNLGVVAATEGNHEQARAHYGRALTIQEKALGPEHPLVAASLTGLGAVANSEGKYEQARAYYERALAIREKALGPEHPLVAASINNLGVVADSEGKYEQARAHYGRALAIWEKALGPDHPDVAASLNNLGAAAFAEGKYEQARAHHERALAIKEKALGPEHPLVAASLNNLGLVAQNEGKYEQARAYYERALAIREKSQGPEHPDVADVLSNLGTVAKLAGQYEQARAHQERALAIREKVLGPDHPGLAVSLNNLGNVALLEGKYEQARAHHERALAIFENVLGTDHPNLAHPLTGLGIALTSLDAPADAIAQLERALALRTGHEGDPAALAETRFALARALWDAPVDAGRDRPRARELAEQAELAYAAAGDQAGIELAEVREWLAGHGL